MATMAKTRTQVLDLVGKLSLCIAVAVAAASPAWAQDNATSATPPQQTAPSLQPPPAGTVNIRFDVVSIRLNKTDSRGGMVRIDPNGDGLIIVNVPLRNIIEFAYNFHRDDLVSGAPDWSRSERYDIEAKVADADVPMYHVLKEGQRRLMLQAVLADRCKLQVHRDPRDRPVYALLVAKGGLKIKESVPANPNGMKGPDGKPVQGEFWNRSGAGQFTGQQMPMPSIALALSEMGLDRQVIDRTGLTGKYDFTLQFTPERSSGSPMSGGGQQESAVAPDSGPSIFTAVQEQLGLKLDPQKGEVEGLVIDHLERPSDN
jgi:uncharacterized protein (TIGR03435 family)